MDFAGERARKLASVQALCQTAISRNHLEWANIVFEDWRELYRWNVMRTFHIRQTVDLRFQVSILIRYRSQSEPKQTRVDKKEPRGVDMGDIAKGD